MICHGCLLMNSQPASVAERLARVLVTAVDLCPQRSQSLRQPKPTHKHWPHVLLALELVDQREYRRERRVTRVREEIDDRDAVVRLRYEGGARVVYENNPQLPRTSPGPGPTRALIEAAVLAGFG